jgi:hypothetical protein
VQYIRSFIQNTEKENAATGPQSTKLQNPNPNRNTLVACDGMRVHILGECGRLRRQSRSPQ